MRAVGELLATDLEEPRARAFGDRPRAVASSPSRRRGSRRSASTSWARTASSTAPSVGGPVEDRDRDRHVHRAARRTSRAGAWSCRHDSDAAIRSIVAVSSDVLALGLRGALLPRALVAPLPASRAASHSALDRSAAVPSLPLGCCHCRGARPSRHVRGRELVRLVDAREHREFAVERRKPARPAERERVELAAGLARRPPSLPRARGATSAVVECERSRRRGWPR